MTNNNDELEVKCPKHNRVFPIHLAEEKQKGVVLVDCPFCFIKHKISFVEESNVEVYRALD